MPERGFEPGSSKNHYIILIVCGLCAPEIYCTSAAGKCQGCEEGFASDPCISPKSILLFSPALQETHCFCCCHERGPHPPKSQPFLALIIPSWVVSQSSDPVRHKDR